MKRINRRLRIRIKVDMRRRHNILGLQMENDLNVGKFENPGDHLNSGIGGM